MAANDMKKEDGEEVASEGVEIGTNNSDGGMKEVLPLTHSLTFIHLSLLSEIADAKFIAPHKRSLAVFQNKCLPLETMPQTRGFVSLPSSST